MKVQARIELLPPEESGRKQPLVGTFWLNHRFRPGTFVIARVQQQPGAELWPGKSADLIVEFLPEGVPALSPGTEWQIYDGPNQLVGHGRVLDVLEQ